MNRYDSRRALALRALLICFALLILSITLPLATSAQEAEGQGSTKLIYEERADQINALVKQQLAQAPEPAEHILRQPCIAPNGEVIAFCFDGDIWTVASTGGTARRLTVTESDEWTPIISPDSKWIAFRSERYGKYDLYVMPIEGGEATRVTWSDEADLPCCWLPDGSGIIFASGRRNHAYDLWVAPVDLAALDPEGDVEADIAREPWPITDGGFRNYEFDASISPDGKTIAYVSGGGYTSYRRRGYTGSSVNEIWLCDFDGVQTSNHRLARGTRAHNFAPRFVTNERLAFASFDADIMNAMSVDYHEPASRIARLGMLSVSDPSKVIDPRDSLKVEDLRDPSVAAEAGVMIYSTTNYSGWHVYRVDIRDRTVKPLEIKIRSGRRGQRATYTTMNRASGQALSPDGKLLAFTSGYDVYLTAPESTAEPVRITDSVGREMGVCWSPNGKQLFYTARRDGSHGIYRYDLASKSEERISPEGVLASCPSFVPSDDAENPTLVYIEEEQRIVYHEAPADRERVIAEGSFAFTAFDNDLGYRFSPKGRWMTWTGFNDLGDAVVMVTELATGEHHQISRLFHNAYGARFSTDGSHLSFIANQEGNYDVYLVELEAKDRVFPEDDLDELIKKAGVKPEPKQPEKKPADQPAKKDESESEDAADEKSEAGDEEEIAPESETDIPAKPEVEPIDLAEIHKRTRRITSLGGDERDPVVLDKGEQVFFLGNDAAGKQNIFQLKLESGKAPQLNQFSKSTGGITKLELSADGKTLVYLDGSVMCSSGIARFQQKATNFAIVKRHEADAMRAETFDEAAEVVRRYFYDENHHGLPWDQVVERYRKVLDSAWTNDEWSSVMNEFLGELNASHQGYYPVDRRSDGGREASAGIGLEFDQAGLARGEYIVAKVLSRGPCDHPQVNIEAGDNLLALNAVALDGSQPISKLLLNRSGKRALLEVQKADGTQFSVPVRAISRSAERELYYGIWVDETRAKVHELSGGRLGYVHIRRMHDDSLNEFRHHLGNDIEGREAVIIDVRFNGGGRTAVDVLEILIKRPWLMRYPRGWSEEGVSENIYRSIALEKPSLLMINEQSFSNAEILAEGFRRLEIGTIVGRETAGGVIGTSSFNLVDGSRMRMPYSGAFGIDGDNLENDGRKPDISVRNHPDELNRGEDAQLKVAVETMLKQLDE